MKNHAVYSTLLDESGNVISCNHSLRKYLGFEAGAQLIGKNILDVFKAWELEKLSKAIETCKANPQLIVTIQTQYKSGERANNVFEWTVSGENDEEGKCIIHLTGRNQTPAPAPKKANRGFTDSEKIYENFMNHSPIVGWVTDEEGIMHYMNPTYLNTYHLSTSDLGKSIFDLFPKNIADDYFSNNQNVLKTGKAIETIENAFAPGGAQQTLKIFKFPITVDGRQMVAGWAVDITEQSQLHEQLSKNVERFYYVKKATSDAVYDWDVRKNIIYRGMGFQTLFGYPHLRGSIRFGFRHIHPDDIDNVKLMVFSSLRDKQATKWKIEYRFRDCDGNYKYVIDKAFIMREAGKAIRVIGAMQDISEQRTLQEKLLSQEKENKRKIVRSIIETQEKERKQLSIELHDNVNQILSSCKLMLDVAKTNQETSASLIEKAYHNLQTAISEIRSISHELNPYELQDLGLVDSISQVFEDINASGKINIRFEHEGFGKECLKEEDRVAVYRIIQENLNNILKHSGAKKAFVKLTLRNGKLKLIMQDDGVGFDINKAKKGIGLRNIKNRVDYYRGSLRLETAPGEGCRMEITLKVQKRALTS